MALIKKGPFGEDVVDSGSSDSSSQAGPFTAYSGSYDPGGHPIGDPEQDPNQYDPVSNPGGTGTGLPSNPNPPPPSPTPPDVTTTPAPTTSSSDIEKQLRDAAAKAGVAYDASDLADVAHRDNTPAAIAMELRKYAARSNNVAGSGVLGNPNGAPGSSGGSAGPFSSPYGSGSQYDDPASMLAEQYALKRLSQVTNPEDGSGQKLYEDFAKHLSDLLQGPVYSDDQEAALRTQAFDQLEQSRQAELRQTADTLGARNIPPSSGVYMSSMKQVNDKWDKLKAANTNTLAVNGINQRQQNLTQALSVLQQLAATQGQRLDAGTVLSQIPLNLQSDAFNRLVGATNLGGSGSTGGLMSLLQTITSQNQFNTGNESAALQNLMEFLFSMPGLLAA